MNNEDYQESLSASATTDGVEDDRFSDKDEIIEDEVIMLLSCHHPDLGSL